MNFEDLKIAVVGLGYVGLPLAVEFSKRQLVIGFDIKKERIEELKKGVDSTGEIEREVLRQTKIEFTNNPSDLRRANFIIVAVPTPIDGSKIPDLTAIKDSAEIIGKNLTKDSIVIYESTVYPGVTEEICGPILEKFSGLRCGDDFKLGYSPERINPGDKEHTIDKVVKIVSAQDAETIEMVARVYSLVCKAGIHRAPNIKIAEAAKVVENIQRDLNIALVNELSLIFHRLGVDTHEVLRAAGTKWNFHKYQPGLVGGHCIGVDPYYLTDLVEKRGYHPELILTARQINEYMPEYVAELMVKGLIEAGKPVRHSKVLVMGLTFKENVKDIRNSKVKDVIRKLKEYQINVLGYDPLLPEGVVNNFGAKNVLSLEDLPKVDGIILCVLHNEFKRLSLDSLKNLMTGKAVLVDIRGFFREVINGSGGFFIYKTL